MNDHTPMMAFWILRDGVPPNKLWQNIITSLHVTNISEAEEGLSDDNDDNGIDIIDEAIEAPNDNNNHEPWSQNPIPRGIERPKKRGKWRGGGRGRGEKKG